MAINRSKNTRPVVYGFLDYLAERGFASITADCYKSDLWAFAKFIGKDLLTVSANDIREFLARRLESVSASTVARQLMTFRSFYAFLLDEGLISSSPAMLVAAVKTQLPIVISPGVDDIDKMLAAIPTTGTEFQIATGLRDRALLLVCYGSGLRVSEICRLQITGIDFLRGVIAVRLGKGNKDRLAPMNPMEAEALKEWLERGRPVFATEETGNLVFVDARYNRGKQMSRQAIFMIFSLLSLGTVGRIISPHKLRHAFCTDTVNGGADIRVVQAMLGHSSLNTTQRYLHSDTEKVTAQYMKYHPRGESCTTR